MNGQEKQQEKQQRRRWWGRKVKGGPECSSSTATMDSTFSEQGETERKRKTKGVLGWGNDHGSNEASFSAAGSKETAATGGGAPTAAAAAGAGAVTLAARGMSASSMTNTVAVVRSRSSGPGRMVDRFEIMDTLGVGYSGKVKRAVDTHTGQMVAIKVISKGGDFDPSRSKKFTRLQAEVKAMKKCGKHPHTVTLHEAKFNASYPKRDGTPEDVYVLVLELCEKGELFDLLHKGGLVPYNVCREYFRQLMVGIDYCHGQGVYHRDLKPENLLLDSHFSLKIADFGFAKIGDPSKMCQSIVGSKTYMAPEVMGHQSHPDQPLGYSGALADVWSAGVILFTMLAGHSPMNLANDSDWWFRALKLGREDLFWKSHERTIRPFPAAAKYLVTRMLTVDPLERITVQQIMGHDYVAPPVSCNPRGGAFSCHSNAPSTSVTDELIVEMHRRYGLSMASKRLCTVASSSRGTANSAAASGSGSPAQAAVATAARGSSRGSYVDTFEQKTYRGPLDDDKDVIPPQMSAEDAARVTNGFMANGEVNDVVKALEVALFAMDAEIEGVEKDGARTFRSSFKVSAVIPAVDKIGGGPVAMVAMVFRVVRDRLAWDGEEGGDRRDPGEAAELVVVLKRKGGDYHRYHNVEANLISRMTMAHGGTESDGWD